MSLNFEGIGTAICIIRPKDSNIKEPPIVIFLANREQKKNVKEGFNTFSLDDKDMDNFEFQIIPYVTDENPRNNCYVSAQSGAGKSWYVKGYLEQFKKMFPKYKIYVFSALATDKGSLDKVKGINRIKLDSEFASENFEITDFTNSVVIYDDTDNIKDKYIKAKLNHIEDMILTTGRHEKCFFIRTSHLPTNGRDTKHILGESQNITIFPSTLGNRTMNYLLGEYLEGTGITYNSF